MKVKTLLSAVSLTLCLTSFSAFADDTKSKVENPQNQTKAQVKREKGSGMATGKRQHKPVSITKPLDKASPLLNKPLTKNNNRAGYRLCPDGTRINPGEKCPEKAAKIGYRLCPDGTRINPGEKCPERKK
ncbi:hypothetical protein FLL45_04005 [Aliikangiella marina]|uniref:Uncharacterized protein n=1 Tax=Aliikangiella marina TaxID=1712262 RepID=A0A545TIS0_9GAMM|nr:type VI secretion system tube protein Hcp [Aliikangiella marina]TQV77122.1 hypothetical protein FLL45_04005 [Aliikangiella marina]